ncbi:hypothetical protein NDU88_006703 [Pleurodeles waltl]|uniref:Uncharacterized protein n=1 Tax=Pleurodeles waltl TaxID=8319 RepID=A0AAV7QJI6_PLEWA|nr:hypothetical protein NDU88_006703 [Pleurodeles waltl]
MLAGNVTKESMHGAGETTRSIAGGGWEITTRAAGFSDHRAAGFLTQVPLGTANTSLCLQLESRNWSLWRDSYSTLWCPSSSWDPERRSWQSKEKEIHAQRAVRGKDRRNSDLRLKKRRAPPPQLNIDARRKRDQ